VYNQWYYNDVGSPAVGVLLATASNDALVTVDSGGCVRVWETGVFNLTKSLAQWRSMIGDASLQHNLQVGLPLVSGHLEQQCNLLAVIVPSTLQIPFHSPVLCAPTFDC